jgi:hypothetical protein
MFLDPFKDSETRLLGDLLWLRRGALHRQGLRPTTAVNRAGCCQSDGVASLKSCQTLKEAYAVRRTVPPSAEIPASIEKLLSNGAAGLPPTATGTPNRNSDVHA